MKTAIVAGGSGLIGSQLLEMLANDDSYKEVIAISRKLQTTSHSKIHNLIVDFDKLAEYTFSLKCDDVFCCLGTTIKQAGTKDAFKKVDLDYPIALAQLTKQQGAKKFLMVTAMGAKSNSTIFYNRVKGEVQQGVSNVGFETLHILQPSFLVGERPVARDYEGTSLKVMQIFDFMIPKKYKAIDSVKVARAMVKYASDPSKGIFIHDSAELQDF